MSKAQHWLAAFRPRTLTLSFSGIFLGSMVAYRNGFFDIVIFLLALATALSLQILSNLANDYGDFVKGTDNEKRTGPERALQSGAINQSQMKSMIVVFIVLSLVFGIALIYMSFSGFLHPSSFAFLLLGIFAVLAALKYTIGKKAYGYSGLGDLFVFIFFGVVAVLGSYFLQAHQWFPLIILPAVSVGFLNVGVLNVNNMRDEENDRDSHKKTLVVLMGNRKAKIYHSFLILGAIIGFLTFSMMTCEHVVEFIYLIPMGLLIRHWIVVLNNKDPKTLDAELKNLAISTFLVCLFFGIGLVR